MTLVIQTDPMKSLQSAQQALALEAISVDSFTSSLKRLLPSIFGGVKEAKGFANDGIEPSKIKFTKEQAKFLKVVKDLRFVAIADMRANVPSGFHGKYADYLAVLTKASAYTRNVDSNVVQPYLRFLATCVSDRRMAVATERGNLRADELEKSRKLHDDAIGSFFVKNDTTQLKIAQVVDNQSDWEGVFRGLEAVSANLQAVDGKGLQKSLYQAEDYLKILKEGLGRSEEPINLSRETSERLAVETYQVACELEFYSILNYRFTALDAAISRTMDTIVDAMG